MTQHLIDVPAGLAGVVAAETELGDVRGTEGFYHYRQYPAVELARIHTVEEVWHLMLFGELPDDARLTDFSRRVRAARRLPEAVTEDLLRDAATDPQPLAALRTALGLATTGSTPLYDQTDAERVDAAITVAALTPVLVAALHRLRDGLPMIRARDDLDHAANYLWMLTGQQPDERRRQAIDSYLISTIDHGFNASTFTARVIASTGADLPSCVLGALGALSGPLHGGAPSRALDTLDAIGSTDRIEDWVNETIDAGGRIMGFGHPVYRTEDPRSAMLKEIALGFGGDRVDLAVAVEDGVLRVLEQRKPDRVLRTNVEYYAGVVMELCGIGRPLFTATFAVARMIGWTAHILEQAADSKIIRPSSRYVGPPPHRRTRGSAGSPNTPRSHRPPAEAVSSPA